MIKWDWSISFARMIAMCFIVTCHFLQFYDNELAWWFNVGVQMFLFISGLLFANRDLDIKSLKNQFLKILLPYYIFTIIACVFWLIFSVDANFKDVLTAILLYGYGDFSGLHHLWFIAYILFAYIMTPLIINVLKLFEKSFFKMICGGFLMIVGFFIFFELFAIYYESAWMICYFMGIFLGRMLNNIDQKIKRGGRYLICIIGILAVISNTVQIVIDYYFHVVFSGILARAYNIFCNYAHVLLGISLVFLLRYIYWKIPQYTERHLILKWSDKYSYYIYLVHQIFILGTFSICSLIKTTFIAVSVTLCVIIVTAIVLYKVSQTVSELTL